MASDFTASQKSIVGITIEDATSSGVVVAPGQVATCFHVIQPALEGGSITVRHGDREFQARIVRQDKSHDLCLLEVPGLDAPSVKLAASVPAINEPVAAMGTPAGHFEKSEGKVEYINQTDALIIFSSAKIRDGFSGGGLFNAAGELVGIAAYSTGNGALPLPWVEQLMNPPKKQKSSHKKTEIDYFLEQNACWGANNFEDSFAVTRRWVNHYPESFFANAELRKFVEGTGKKAKEAVYQAAKKAYALWPSASNLGWRAKTARWSHYFEEAIALRWQLAELQPDKKNDILYDNIIDAFNMPAEAKVSIAQRILTFDVDNKTRREAYDLLAKAYLQSGQVAKAWENKQAAASYEDADYKALLKFKHAVHFVEELARSPSKKADTQETVFACAKYAYGLLDDALYKPGPFAASDLPLNTLQAAIAECMGSHLAEQICRDASAAVNKERGREGR